jgi:hypothetical protein
MALRFDRCNIRADRHINIRRKRHFMRDLVVDAFFKSASFTACLFAMPTRLATTTDGILS